MRSGSRRRHRDGEHRKGPRSGSDHLGCGVVGLCVRRSGCRSAFFAREASLREDGLVEAIARIAASTIRGKKLRLGIGDDAAAWKPARSSETIITTDALVENVHFLVDAMEAGDVGWRALASNLSDVAAMGARPLLATVALGVPRSAREDWILDCYRGMAELAKRSGVAIAGGDIVRAPALFISITAIGEVRASNRKTRAGVRPGDVFAVTGPLGASRAGVEMLLERPDLAGDPAFAPAIAAYRRPHARLFEGLRFGASRNVHAMMDISDGLSTDLRRMCAASRVGAIVDAAQIPIAPVAEAFAALTTRDALRYGLGGGEEFELLVAVAPRAFRAVAQAFARSFKRPLRQIGTATASPDVVLLDAGRTRELEPSGWESLGP
jgi:thiamine-monophosphate kinase